MLPRLGLAFVTISLLATIAVAEIDVTQIAVNPPPDYSGFYPCHGTTRFIFAATHRDYGRELWIMDHQTGERTVVDIFDGWVGSLPASNVFPAALNFVSLNNGRVIFTATSKDGGNQVWVTDCTKTGTTVLVDLALGDKNLDLRVLQVNATEAAVMYRLHTQPPVFAFTDGTVAGTVWNLTSTITSPRQAVACLNSLFIRAASGNYVVSRAGGVESFGLANFESFYCHSGASRPGLYAFINATAFNLVDSLPISLETLITIESAPPKLPIMFSFHSLPYFIYIIDATSVHFYKWQTADIAPHSVYNSTVQLNPSGAVTAMVVGNFTIIRVNNELYKFNEIDFALFSIPLTKNGPVVPLKTPIDGDMIGIFQYIDGGVFKWGAIEASTEQFTTFGQGPCFFPPTLAVSEVPPALDLTGSATGVLVATYTQENGTVLAYYTGDGVDVDFFADLAEGPDYAADISTITSSPLASGEYLFSMWASNTGLELWKTDGTTYSLVKEFYPGCRPGNPDLSHALPSGDRRVAAFPASGSSPLFVVSDGTASGTITFDNLPDVLPLDVCGDVLFFSTTAQTELWSYNFSTPATPPEQVHSSSYVVRGWCIDPVTFFFHTFDPVSSTGDMSLLLYSIPSNSTYPVSGVDPSGWSNTRTAEATLFNGSLLMNLLLPGPSVFYPKFLDAKNGVLSDIPGLASPGSSPARFHKLNESVVAILFQNGTGNWQMRGYNDLNETETVFPSSNTHIVDVSTTGWNPVSNGEKLFTPIFAGAGRVNFAVTDLTRDGTINANQTKLSVVHSAELLLITHDLAIGYADTAIALINTAGESVIWTSAINGFDATAKIAKTDQGMILVGKFNGLPGVFSMPLPCLSHSDCATASPTTLYCNHTTYTCVASPPVSAPTASPDSNDCLSSVGSKSLTDAVCTPEGIFVPGNLTLNGTTPIVTISVPVFINGSFSFTNGTLVFANPNAQINASGCVQIDGGIAQIQIDPNTVANGATQLLIQSGGNCLSGQFQGIQLLGNSQNGCPRNVSSSSSYTSSSLTMLFSVEEKDCDDGIGLETPAIVGAVVGAILGAALLALLVILLIPAARRKVFPFLKRKDEEKLHA